MTRYLLTLPVAALMCGAAFAQTPAADGTYGSTWSRSTGAMFYSDPEMTTMRTPDEVSTSWSTLSQEDRDAVMAECVRYRTESGTTAATATGTAKTETTAAPEGAAAEGAAAGDAAASDPAATMSVSAENMKSICDMVEAY